MTNSEGTIAKKVEISIIIVHYNTFQYTKNCVNSIFNLTRDINFEIIVVSNNCHDRPIIDLLEFYPSLILIENDLNVGFAKANNIGIQHSSGEVILLLNSDTELQNNAIKICYDKLMADKSIGALTCKLVFPDEKPQSVAQSFPTLKGELLETSRLFKFMKKDRYARCFQNSLLDLNSSHYCDWIWGAFFMFKKEHLNEFEYKQLSERFFMYGEDMEWCYQFTQLNLRSFYNADAKVLHFMGKSEFGTNHQKWSAIARNEILTLKKFRGNTITWFIKFMKVLKYSIAGIKSKELRVLAKIYLRS